MYWTLTFYFMIHIVLANLKIMWFMSHIRLSKNWMALKMHMENWDLMQERQ